MSRPSKEPCNFDPRRMGTEERPFPNPHAVFNFLAGDNPQAFVFRGQVQAYEGPILPSHYRDHFCPFPAPETRGGWAGMTLRYEKRKAQMESRKHALGEPRNTGVGELEERSAWDLSDSDFQSGFEVFFSKARTSRQTDLHRVLREQTVPGLSFLLGNSLGILLAQQYGFASEALDVTTDPAIAIFFATNCAPFYTSVENSSELGVCYRWPRCKAMVAEELTEPLEQDSFTGCVSMFRNYISENNCLHLGPSDRTEMSDGRIRRYQFVKSTGLDRELSLLVFPRGAFADSRMGRQKAALLWPVTETVRAAMLDPK